MLADAISPGPNLSFGGDGYPKIGSECAARKVQQRHLNKKNSQ